MHLLGYFAVSMASWCCVGGVISSGSVLQTMQTTNGLKTFGSWCDSANRGFYGGSTKITVFAFNDTSFNTMASQDRARLQSMNEDERKQYVATFTLISVLNINEMRDNERRFSMNGRELFINKRDVYNWAFGGSSGRTATFVNGAMIIREQIQATNGVIHVLDRPLGMMSNKNCYDYMMYPDDSSIQTTMVHDYLILKLMSEYYAECIWPLASLDQVTLFLPSERAMSRIPSQKLNSLSPYELSQYFRMHFIPGRVVFTSFVRHQDNYQSGYDRSRVLFLRNGDEVLVKSGGVTATIERGNITVRNGVIHIIDRMLGYVYNSAREQLAQDAITFNRLIDLADPRIQTDVTQPSGVNLFVPTDEAFQYVQNLPWINLDGNRTLINFIIQLSLLKSGELNVAQLNGNYDVRQRRETRYNGWMAIIYNDRNETWANIGNVRCRIIRPDIKVTTGQLQYLDAVPGIPSMDIPTLIYYDDWLLYTYNDMKMLGLDTYLKDQRYDPSILPPRSFNGNGDPTNNYGVGNNFQVTPDPYGNNQGYPNNNQGYPSSGGYPNNNQNYPSNNNQNYPNNNYNNQNYGNQNYGNQNYGNQNYGNNYPQNQYPNNQYPTNNQISPYGTCGTYNQPCQFTFFVPNGTAIYDYYLYNVGNRIIQDHPRYRFIFRRLIIPNNLIFIERLSPGAQSYPLRAHNGETITLKKETDNIARLYWGGESARVIMWDLGATNGVVHIIDRVLSDTSDINRDISQASSLFSMNCYFMLAIATFLSIWFVRR